MEMPMPMWFYTSTEVYFLLKHCVSQTVGGLILGCFVSFLFAFSLPLLTAAKIRIICLKKSPEIASNQFPATDVKKIQKGKATITKRLILTALTGIQYGIAGLVMLLLMTYSVWVFISIVVGYTISYFLFSSAEECHGPSTESVTCH